MIASARFPQRHISCDSLLTGSSATVEMIGEFENADQAHVLGRNAGTSSANPQRRHQKKRYNGLQGILLLAHHSTAEAQMETPTGTDQERESFAETALRLGGKSEEEARRMGAVDKADEQVESLFAPQYQTASSPVHKAIWEGRVSLDLFNPPPLPA